MADEPLRWYRIDEHSYAVVATQYAAKRFVEVCGDWQQLPWAIIALHNAAQAAMVCHLTGTAGIGALEKKCAVATYAALNGEGDYPAEFMARFKELLRRTANASRQLEQGGGQISLGIPDRRALLRLLSLRNEFAHFSPKGWSIEITGLPDIASSWARLMHGIQGAGWALRHCEEVDQLTFQESVALVERRAIGMFAP